jgi:6-phosphogluconolactonase
VSMYQLMYLSKRKIAIVVCLLTVLFCSCSRTDLWNKFHSSYLSLTYPTTSAVYTRNAVITNNVPTVTGPVTSWSVNPSLPAGLTLNTSTGVISGTPLAQQSAASYTITASNSYGSTTALVTIEVIISYKYFLYFGDNSSANIYKYEIDISSGGLINPNSFANTLSYTNSLTADSSRNILYTACAGSHNMSSFSITVSDGSLVSLFPNRVTGDSTDRLILHPNGNFLYGIGSSGSFNEDVSTYGGITNITCYIASGGTGFFDNAIKPSGDYLYVTNNSSNDIARFIINQGTGGLSSPVLYSAAVNSPQYIVIHPTLNYLYVLQPWTVQGFSINPVDGSITSGASDGMSGNQAFLAIDPLGRFLYSANQGSFPVPNDPINVYSIDQTTGAIIPNGGSVYISGTASGVGFNHFMVIDPTGHYLYEYIEDSNNIQEYSIDQSSGVLTQLAQILAFPGTQARSPIIVRMAQ